MELNLSKLIDEISKVEGVLAIILFGSRARGDYDEYSDYDILVIFENDDIMWKNREKIYENVGKLKLFVQVLTRSMRELKEETEPTFLKTVMKDGKVLYLRHPLQVPAYFQELKPMIIVSYTLSQLSQKEKMKVIYRLFGKGKFKGLIGKYGGLKLGDRCFMIPENYLKEIRNVFEKYDINYSTLKIYAKLET